MHLVSLAYLQKLVVSLQPTSKIHNIFKRFAVTNIILNFGQLGKFGKCRKVFAVQLNKQ